MKELMFQKELILIISNDKSIMICHYWYFKDIGYKFEPNVCHKCHNISVMDYELENIAVLNLKSIDCRCVLQNMTKTDAISRLISFKLFNESIL